MQVSFLGCALRRSHEQSIILENTFVEQYLGFSHARHFWILALNSFKHSVLLRTDVNSEADHWFQQHIFYFAGVLVACVQTVNSASRHNIEGVQAVLAPNTCQAMLSKPSVGRQSLLKSSTHKLEMLSALTRSQMCSWRYEAFCVNL